MGGIMSGANNTSYLGGAKTLFDKATESNTKTVEVPMEPTAANNAGINPNRKRRKSTLNIPGQTTTTNTTGV